MNNRLKGYYRDNLILQAVEEWGVMDTKIITALFFDNMKNYKCSLRKAQERMSKIFGKGKVKRWSYDYLKEYIYSLEEKSGRGEHKLMLNWIRLWQIKSLKSWEKLHCFQYEDDYAFMRSDAFVAIKNTMTGKFNLLFIEADRSLNGFDKVIKYNKLFEAINNGKYERWWAKLVDKFPMVLIVTTTPMRKEKILHHIEQDNKNGLNFEVKLLSEIKKEAIRI